MDGELTHFLGRNGYMCAERGSDHRNCTYGRKFVVKSTGEVISNVPRDQKRELATQGQSSEQVIQGSFSTGSVRNVLGDMSTRTLSMIFHRLIGRNISASEISKALVEAVEKWRERDISQEFFKYIFVDGMTFTMRIG
jgi:transposase-like protein